MAILRFSFSAVGESRDSTLEELDRATRIVMENVGGEPWITTADDVKKVQVAPGADPGNFVYYGVQEIQFAGPAVLGHKIEQFRDGFRPQPPLGEGPFFSA